ncbi:hypothetical protein F5Y02DRAFT_372244 [Annulohypoxylon stygium]|nr:hypothetical protein F5Y02DRAFT_372244 [Annulohypoxylon stygium]
MRDSSCELRHSVSQSHRQFPSESQHSQRTESSYNPQNHCLEDWQRDVPQALLFPHSLDTAAPGRQVLLRHQRVILAPPTPPPSMTGMTQLDIDDEKQGGMMRMKMERMKRWWVGMYTPFHLTYLYHHPYSSSPSIPISTLTLYPFIQLR